MNYRVISIDGITFDSPDVMYDIINEFHSQGDKITIFTGQLRKPSHSDFIDISFIKNLVNEIKEKSIDDNGVWAALYLEDVTEERIDDLHKTIIEWFNKNTNQPKFHDVNNINEINYIVGDIL